MMIIEGVTVQRNLSRSPTPVQKVQVNYANENASEKAGDNGDAKVDDNVHDKLDTSNTHSPAEKNIIPIALDNNESSER